MMNHFKSQSLIFYGVAISSVLLLFKVVTAYGEASVKAPTPIEGSYRLSLKGSVPKCSLVPNLLLNIQQSGIYLNGSLSLTSNNSQEASATAEKPSLTGSLKDQQLLLSGKVSNSTLCSNPVSSASSLVTIQSQVQGETLVGKLALSTTGAEFQFTAQRETPAQPTQNPSNH